MQKHSNDPRMALAEVDAGGRRALTTALAIAATLLGTSAFAQSFPNLPITPEQRTTASQVAQAGVPLSELASGAPDEYTVKRGDTLWGISGIFLTRPWRWPELWGMNFEQIHNPHLIYPGQQLVLDKSGDRAMLRLQAAVTDGDRPIETVRLSPRVRVESLADTSLPTLKSNLIEPFLSEPVIVDEGTLLKAPRIVAAPENRVLITRGDRAYARGISPLMQRVTGRSDEYRVFREARPLKDPFTQVILGYEAQYLGKAMLVHGESSELIRKVGGAQESLPVPATIDIVSAKEEMRVGDRLLPEPPRQFQSYVPHTPAGPIEAAVVSVYGDAVTYAGQNQVVVINKGTADGIESGHVLAILKQGDQRLDVSQPGERTQIKLPSEHNGLLMVFRPFEKLSYALILEINDTVSVGDRVTNPR
jgi:nucleoid-associated protein YgaU